MEAHPLAIYLRDCRARRGSGLIRTESDLYPTLEALLNAVGHTLTPRVRCFMNLRDGGLFTAVQIARDGDAPAVGTRPSRGVIVCKPLADDVLGIAETQQISEYRDGSCQILVTNYREFLLVGRDEFGRPVRHEHYRLASTESEFWQQAANPEALVREHGDGLLDFLERCLRRPVELSDPADVAWFLASYAREARRRIKRGSAGPAMVSVRQALEDELGLHEADAGGERFFQSTLVQTLFYGLFSAWVLWRRSERSEDERFNWERSSHCLHVPVLRKLFRELNEPTQLDSRDGLAEVMGWAGETLNRVVPGPFFETFSDAEAVQYFYEPFLEAFDPDLRKKLGVWYTPLEIVKYMVARVDQVLRSDFDRPDGLADPGIYVLDPCCGTGAYVVEVLRTIAGTLAEKGEGALLASRLKQAATDRVFGFEILPAPFVIAHLQVGLSLQQHGTALDELNGERAAVYLTNALTGWRPPQGPKARLLFPGRDEELNESDAVQGREPILVVIGNPPYNGIAGLPAEEEVGLVEPYRTTQSAPKPQGQGLNDLYVRFFRVAERCITERPASGGIVCYVSNYSWLDGASHTGLRERFRDEFNDVWIDSLNGDKYRTGKTTPDGEPDPSAFSTPHNREGIQVGTGVTLMVRRPGHKGPAKVRFREFWGARKREELLASGEDFQPQTYSEVKLAAALGLPFREMSACHHYAGWPLIVNLFPKSFPGVKTSRDDALVHDDRTILTRHMEQYFDGNFSDEEIAGIVPRLMTDASGFNARSTRAQLVSRGMIPENVVRYGYRPFDLRWIYWEPETKLLDRNRPELFQQLTPENYFLYTTGRTRKDRVEPAILTRTLADLNLMDSGARGIPLFVADDARQPSDRHVNGRFKPNISAAAEGYLQATNADHAGLFFHCLATLHSDLYRTENFSGLKSNWPRIPLPASREELLRSAELGRRVAALLDLEASVRGVTSGEVRRELNSLGQPSRVDGGQLSGRDYAVTARWGIAGKGGITMPGRGKVNVRAFTPVEAAALGESGIELLGPDTLDVHLNDDAYWCNVPRRIWEYTLGGYQVLKKWLSYREETLLGRPLTTEETGYVRDVVRRIAALLLLGPDLDENYQRTRTESFQWPGRPDQ